jgi:hypothetical protein
VADLGLEETEVSDLAFWCAGRAGLLDSLASFFLSLELMFSLVSRRVSQAAVSPARVLDLEGLGRDEAPGILISLIGSSTSGCFIQRRVLDQVGGLR